MEPMRKRIVPPYMGGEVLKSSPIQPPPTTVLLEDLSIYLDAFKFLVERSYWTTRHEFVVEVINDDQTTLAPGATEATAGKPT